jgi:hypothetical protein
MPTDQERAREAAGQFAQALADRDYEGAHALLAAEDQAAMGPAELRRRFEAIVPADWPTVGPVVASDPWPDWPGRRPRDLGRVYVTVGGDVYSEAIVVTVTADGGVLRVRDVEFGRP